MRHASQSERVPPRCDLFAWGCRSVCLFWDAKSLLLPKQRNHKGVNWAANVVVCGGPYTTRLTLNGLVKLSGWAVVCYLVMMSIRSIWSMKTIKSSTMASTVYGAVEKLESLVQAEQTWARLQPIGKCGECWSGF